MSKHQATSGSVAVQYRDIADFPGYKFGDDGSVWSAWRGKRLTNEWTRIAGWIGEGGYRRVMLTGRRMYLIHRIILLAFIGPCPDGMQCLHLNSIKTDCRLSNLKWGTREENMDDVRNRKANPRGEQHYRCKLTDDYVREIRRRYESGGVFQRELAVEFGVTCRTVGRIVNGEQWNHVS